MIRIFLPLLLLLAATGCASCDEPRDGGPEPECRLGSVDCGCDETRCDTNLSCEAGICRGVLTTGLKIVDPLARSCEVLLTETGGVFKEAVFGSAVTGRVVREGNRAALAFHANGDAAIGGDAVQVAFTGQVQRIDQALDLSSARCFDAAGAPLVGAGLTF